MDTKELYREILNEHNLHPAHKHELEGNKDALSKQIGGGCCGARSCGQKNVLSLQGVNPSCGDSITLHLAIDDKDGERRIADASFTGAGCAISQASCDMMLDLVIGKTASEAKHLGDVFMRMIKNPDSVTEAEIEELDEAATLQDIAKMPARTKCAVLGWRTMAQMIDGQDGV